MPTALNTNEPLILNRRQVRDVDRRAIQEFGMTGLVLMENAGRGVADVMCSLLLRESPQSISPSPQITTQKPSPRGEGRVRGSETVDSPIKQTKAADQSAQVASDSASSPLTPTFAPGEREPEVSIVCGKGNNGGDGFVIARHLDLRGFGVKILLLAAPQDLIGDAATNFAIAEKAGIAIEVFDAPSEEAKFAVTKFTAAIAGSQWLVDAMLGTGATGEPKSPLAEAIELMNASGKPILAVDLPSGLDCDTGAAALHTIRAAHTCTFVAAKPGFMVPAAQQFIGQLHVLDIGVPRKLLAEIASD
ncbi:MAG TPA: NAD(P)H-hydrate epimerase [Pirellulales bacterium]|jgi:NAD(P)H-hydrate epimerase